MNKNELLDYLIKMQKEKLSLQQSAIDQLRNELENDTKSSAGDKHETSRAMVQREMEQLGSQFAETKKVIEILHRLSYTPKATLVSNGSLVVLNSNFVLMGIGLGKILFQDKVVFCVSPNAPISKNLIGKKEGDTIQFNNTDEKITSIS